MKVAIMQPYFFPYIGYFQLIQQSDVFVIYDNIEYTKKGWINRNRILVNEKEDLISLPLKKDSDTLHVNQRFLSDTWNTDKTKLLNKVRTNYSKAPFFSETYPLFDRCINAQYVNLFDFLFYSIEQICVHLGIETKRVASSTIDIDHTLKAEKRVKAICSKIGGTTYINPIGGTTLYDKIDFEKEGIQLFFLKTNNIVYPQFKNEFIPFLSILDVMMFNSKESIKEYLNTGFSIV